MPDTPPPLPPTDGPTPTGGADGGAAGPVQLRTLADAALALAISERTLRRLITAGKVRAVKVAGAVRISERELQRVALEGTD